jgi:hypothetical protein
MQMAYVLKLFATRLSSCLNKKEKGKKELVESEERPVAISWGIELTLQRQRNAPPTSITLHSTSSSYC